MYGFRTAVLAAAAVALVAACKSGESFAPGLGNLPIDSIPGLPQVGGSTTLRDRTIALDAVERVVATLPGQDFAADTKLLVQTMKALPQFADAGSSADGTVWGQFKGGYLVFVVHGGPPTAPAFDRAPAMSNSSRSARSFGTAEHSGFAAPARLPARSFAESAAGAALAGGAGTVPTSNRYQLFDAVGSYFGDSDPRADIESMLVANGYSGTRQDATLPALRAVTNDGILYIRAHGGLGSVNSDASTRDIYALWTASEALDSTAEANDPTLQQDLQQNRVVYMLFRADRWSNGLPAFVPPNRHYGITDKFISAYMTLSPNSLVYIDACQGAAQPQLIAAFHNASVFAGWSERAAFSAMGPTAKYVFDRLLGANKFAPESPKQRPFPYDVITSDPKFGHGKAYGYSVWPSRAGGTIEADLVFTQVGGNFGILTPSIQTLLANEIDKELWLVGNFGDDPGSNGKVTIDDGSGPVALAVVEWTPSRIRASLPPSAPGAYGNVVVTVRGHESNTRQLLSWQGTLVYTIRDLGTLTQRFEIDIKGRADPHDIRDQIAKTPVPTQSAGFSTNPTTEVRFEAGGEYSDPEPPCTTTYDWSGTTTIHATSTTVSGGQTYVYGATLDMQQRAALFTVVASDNNALHLKTTTACGGSTSTSNEDLSANVDLIGTGFVPVGPPPVLKMALDGSLAISGQSLQHMAESQIFASKNVPYTLTWSTISARPAYDPTLPR